MPGPANAGAPPVGVNLDIRGRRPRYPHVRGTNHRLYPTDVSCQPTGPDLNTSKKYRLILGVEQPARCEGLEKSKSDYVRFSGSDIFWRRPFGPSL